MSIECSAQSVARWEHTGQISELCCQFRYQYQQAQQ